MKKINENKLNPLLEAMNDIDDAIVSEAAPAKRKRPMHFKPLMIAAAAALVCGATAVTATASIKMRETVRFNNEEPVDLGYDIYTDEFGWEIRTYTFNLPEYCLLEEVEGRNPVGKLRAAHTEMYSGPDNKWYLIDEEGNIFSADEGVNNVFVQIEYTGKNKHGGTGYGGTHSYVSNFDYDHFGTHSNCIGDSLNVYITQHTPFDTEE